MIAPRTDIPAAPETEVAKERAALQRLAEPLARTYGTVQNFGTSAEAVKAVIGEIGEVVLARDIDVTAVDSMSTLALTISNRHLVAVEGLAIDVSGAESQAIVEAIEQALSGAKCLRFDIVARTPEIPSSARSWSFKALWDALHSSVEAGCAHPVFVDVKALSIAWLEVESGDKAGPEAALRALQHMTQSDADFAGQVDQFRQDRPHMALFSMTEQMFAVKVSKHGKVLLAICETSARVELLAMWRKLVAVELPS